MLSSQIICNTCGGARNPARHDGHCPVCLLAAAFEDSDALGNIGGHELIEEIARGGMGVVYRARQREPERVVALKTLRGADLDSPAAIVRFRQEAKAMADLEHPAILPVFAFGEQDGIPFFTMKLATGGTLAQRLADYAGKWREITELVARVADAVQHAHTRAVLHRDLKPANILFDESGHAFVSDFGLAKLLDSADSHLTQTTAMLGTPHYLAPEIAAHDTRAATTASDVWSLGVILYELLTQRRPFEGDSVPAVLRAITDTEPAPLREVPRDLAVIATKALEKEPARRYGSARELAEDLRRWLGGRSILARPVSQFEKLRLGARRNPRLAALSVLLLLALGAAFAMLVSARREAVGRLRVSLLAQAHASNTSTEPGQRGAVLDALRQAAQLAPGADIRDEFITALALPDYAQRARIPWSDGVDPALTRDLQTVAARENRRVVIRAPGAAAMVVPTLQEAVEYPGPFNSDGSLLAIHTATTTSVWNLASRTWVALEPGRTSIPLGCDEDFSPDGRWLARVSKPESQDDSEIEIYALSHSAPVRVLPVPWKRQRLLGFSPDSTLLAVSGYGGPEIAVVDALTGDVRHTFRHPETARVRCAAWRADGAVLAVGTDNSKVYLWRLADERLPVEFLGYSGNVIAASWNPDGNRLITAARDGSTRLWDATTGATLAEWPWTSRLVQIAADGSEFAAHDEVGAATIISRLRAPDFCREIAVPFPDLDVQGSAGSWAVAFSSDGRTLLAGDTLGVFLFEAASGSPIGNQPANFCWSIACPDAASFCGGTRDGVFRWPMSGDGKASGVRIFDRDPHSLHAASGLLAITEKKTLNLFKNDQPVGVLESSAELDAELDRVALHPAGVWAVCGHFEIPGLTVWDLRDLAAPPRILKTMGYEPSVAWTPDGHLLLVGDDQGVRALAADTFAEKWRVPRRLRVKRATLLAVADTAALGAAVIEEGVITLFEPATGRIFARLAHPHRRDIRHVAISPDGNHVAAMTAGHIIQYWDLALIRRELAAERLDWR